MRRLMPRHYDVDLSPVITEKATAASEHNKVVFSVRPDATKPEIKAAVRSCSTSRSRRSTRSSARARRKSFRGRAGPSRT